MTVSDDKPVKLGLALSSGTFVPGSFTIGCDGYGRNRNSGSLQESCSKLPLTVPPASFSQRSTRRYAGLTGGMNLSRKASLEGDRVEITMPINGAAKRKEPRFFPNNFLVAR
jgi:hypothetical protein